MNRSKSKIIFGSQFDPITSGAIGSYHGNSVKFTWDANYSLWFQGSTSSSTIRGQGGGSYEIYCDCKLTGDLGADQVVGGQCDPFMLSSGEYGCITTSCTECAMSKIAVIVDRSSYSGSQRLVNITSEFIRLNNATDTSTRLTSSNMRPVTADSDIDIWHRLNFTSEETLLSLQDDMSKLPDITGLNFNESVFVPYMVKNRYREFEKALIRILWSAVGNAWSRAANGMGLLGLPQSALIRVVLVTVPLQILLEYNNLQAFRWVFVAGLYFDYVSWKVIDFLNHSARFSEKVNAHNQGILYHDDSS